MNDILQQYDCEYHQNVWHGAHPDYSFVAGTEQNIYDLQYIFYEGVTDLFSSGLLNRAVPLVVMKVLVTTYGASWIADPAGNYIGITHPSWDCIITEKNLLSDDGISTSEAVDVDIPEEYPLLHYAHLVEQIKRRGIFGRQ